MQDSNLPPGVTQADIDDHAEGRINRGLDRLALDIQRYDQNQDDAGDAYAVAERIDAHEME